MTVGQAGAVWTNRYNNARTGATLTESVLTPATVGLAGKFGLLFSMPVDGTVQAQPLYVPGVTIKGSVHNTVFVATEHNTVYAYDADAAGPALWTQSLGPSAPSSQAIYFCADLFPEIGVNSTPVIDTASGTIYVVAKTLEAGNRHHRLHALDITTGAERTGSPADIAPPGFNPFIEQNRAGLLLEGGVVYVAFASHCDAANYHGWVVAFDAKTLALRGTFNDTPSGNQGGIWQSGMGLSADGTGVYFVAGNGTFDPSGNHANAAMTVGRLTLGSGGLAIADFYTPYNSANLNGSDSDLSTGAVIGVGTNYLYVSGKDSHMRVLDRSNL
ncbi:MAG: PQQ-like beta-propeller repeat protein, partial [Myxococcota bacterium]|nr:PQQ-like beta-propeller repeat protein [Myxococcota bacterium]